MSSISNGWLFWSVNHGSIAWNSEWNVFKKTWYFGEISNGLLPNDLFEKYVCKALNLVDNHCWQYHNELIILL